MRARLLPTAADAKAYFERGCGLFDPADSPETLIRKRCSLGLNAGALLAGVSAWWGESTDLRYAYLPTCVVAIIFMALFAATRRVPPTVLSWNLLCYTPIVLGLDWIRAALLTQRVWPCAVLILDVNLVTGGPPAMPLLILGLTVLSLAVVLMEDSFRFGLYDAVSSVENVATACECGNPPCFSGGAATAFGEFGANCYVLCMDFYFTRRFARSMFSAQKSMETSIDTAHSIAHALAGFDLDAATTFLDSSADLPEGLRDAFAQLLMNLTSYKPYIPEAILSTRYSFQETPVNEPPGLRSGVAAIVFTDIKASTATWQAEPTVMKQALRMHNKVMRTVIRRFDGYEVKTIGDSFMVAFDSLKSAVGFGLASHVVLYEQDWPAELMVLPQCARLAGVWNGLRIRVGVHYGEVEVETNEVNDRFDYFGPTVNKAARLEGACPPGGIALDSSVAGTVCDVFVDQAISEDIGLVELHGLGKTGVRVFYPYSLSARINSTQAVSPKHGCKPHVKACSASRSTNSYPSAAPESERASPAGALAWTENKRLTMSTVGVFAPHAMALKHICEEGVNWSVAHLNESLAWIQLCLDRSDGCILSVIGSSVYFTWNVLQPCASHAENACRFALLAQQDNDALVIGLCCSKHAMVTLTAGRQKYVTVIGYGVKVAEQVCRRATELECPVLYALLTDSALPSSLAALLVHRETWDSQAATFALYSTKVPGPDEGENTAVQKLCRNLSASLNKDEERC
ncbi:Adenylate cyclase [Diplonema papillatum]|nr:Adenylate cyclase [Diplonema papillatum]